MDDRTEARPTEALESQAQAAADQLAWSTEEPGDEPLHPRTWRSTLVRAGALMVVGGAAAAAVWTLGWHPTSHHAPPAAPSTTHAPAAEPKTPLAPTAVTPIETVPPQESDPLTPTDHRFIAQLGRDGIAPRNPGTEGAAVFTGHAICRHLSEGMSYADVQNSMIQYLTAAQADTYIQDAAMFYCPSAIP
ncbi:hypothetical protein A5658_22005 [Mycobacterium sp. 1245111.1]|uniref:DUF732 domain-containing protein n=1 Tax=Mycobacterium sp. 1245111.1 TaxID=1834073 RepID=UPI0007FE3063|nr:DUF732 domain-containing protein [Mycobacterium sp. 1245111.1]OBK40310.1 hypothetical protein A5658_22005 [Mycobacterium sp. 1245111.1]